MRDIKDLCARIEDELSKIADNGLTTGNLDMTYKLIFSKEAANDIDELFQYISVSLFSPIAAKNLMREIDNAISLLKT